MQRARDRKERGNPPGKLEDPLGDQITWEQLLTYCKGAKQLWIITEDQDYFIRHNKKLLLDPLLYRDLTNACGRELNVWAFDKLDDGIIDFSKKAGVKVEDLPTEEEAREIKEEIDALPPLGWITDTTMATPYRRHRRPAWLAYDSMQGVPPGEMPIVLRATTDEPSLAARSGSDKPTE